MLEPLANPKSKLRWPVVAAALVAALGACRPPTDAQSSALSACYGSACPDAGGVLDADDGAGSGMLDAGDGAGSGVLDAGDGAGSGSADAGVEYGNDSDFDGVDDAVDNCVLFANPDQADEDYDGVGDMCEAGDNDNDGVDDSEDNCVYVANALQGDVDGDGIGDACDPENGMDPDDDHDGASDASDNCPHVYNPDQLDTDGDGVGNACDTEDGDNPDDDGDGVPDDEDNCPLVGNSDQTDSNADGVGDACDEIADCGIALASALAGQTAGATNCAPPPTCDSTKVEFTASMSLSSGAHHAKADQHIRTPNFSADYAETCPDNDCSGFFRHGRSATIRWRAWCVKSGDTCVARVDVPDPFVKGVPVNVGGAWRHSHFPLGPGHHTCAFIDTGTGIRGTSDCVVSGQEKVVAHANMTMSGDGVVYGSGYGANHDNSNQPSIGLSVGYGGTGAFVILNNNGNATYTKAMSWAQGMGCDTEGKPRKLTSDGDGRPYPLASSGEGNE